ncbi:hypothetical protein HY345_03175 [Candidatus Microgenomates bacterium]|nr:hypothetical protein [Candidatus Microgenomates bacterium]
MRKLFALAVVAVVFVFVARSAMAVQPAGKGFDGFGYNYQARVFVGDADGVDRNLDGTVWGDPVYANDHLVMKWSKAWDDARFHGAAWTPEAWVDNEWNGMLPDGSRTTEHVKIIWVGPDLENSPYWRDGGYAIWGEFEAILDQGMVNGEHVWWTHAQPAGYGSN